MNIDTESTANATPDLELFGDPDMWLLISKASSARGGWMRSTKALQIPGVGCLVQVSTQRDGNVAESVTFVPGIEVAEDRAADGKISGRRLIHGF